MGEQNEQGEKRELRFRKGHEQSGEWVTTRYMIQDLKLFTLEQLGLMTGKDVVKSYDGDINSSTHLNRARTALMIAKNQHSEKK